MMIKFLKIEGAEFDLSFQKEMYKNIIKCEEETLMKALQQYLGKEPTIEDFKKCQRIFRVGVNDKYTFAYDGTVLGKIEKRFEGLSFSVNFIPC